MILGCEPFLLGTFLLQTMYNINNLIGIVTTKRKVYFNIYTSRNFKFFAWFYLSNFKPI